MELTNELVQRIRSSGWTLTEKSDGVYLLAHPDTDLSIEVRAKTEKELIDVIIDKIESYDAQAEAAVRFNESQDNEKTLLSCLEDAEYNYSFLVELGTDLTSLKHERRSRRHG